MVTETTETTSPISINEQVIFFCLNALSLIYIIDIFFIQISPHFFFSCNSEFLDNDCLEFQLAGHRSMIHAQNDFFKFHFVKVTCIELWIAQNNHIHDWDIHKVVDSRCFFCRYHKIQFNQWTWLSNKLFWRNSSFNSFLCLIFRYELTAKSSLRSSINHFHEIFTVVLAVVASHVVLFAK